MFEKLYSKCVLVCDGECEQEHTFDTFDEMTDFVEDEGWQTKYYMGEYLHYCPECREG